MAGLAAVTTRIKLFATGADADHAAGDRRAHGATIDSISTGRFGLNLITGWQKAGVRPDGPVAGRRVLRHRYNYAAEYVTSCRSCGRPASRDFKGEFFKMNDCRLSPRPKAD